MSKTPTMTTASGCPMADNQNSLTAGPRGPLLAQDWQLFEKHAHFNRERIPERIPFRINQATHFFLQFDSFSVSTFIVVSVFRWSCPEEVAQLIISLEVGF